jgi:hypothetical protein
VPSRVAHGGEPEAQIWLSKQQRRSPQQPWDEMGWNAPVSFPCREGKSHVADESGASPGLLRFSEGQD